jgi:hypothetical protein
VDLVGKYNVTPSAVTAYKEKDVYEDALAHDAIFFRGWPGNLRDYENRYGDKIRNIEVAAPHFAGAEPAAVFGGWNLMISERFRQESRSRPIYQICHQQSDAAIHL